MKKILAVVVAAVSLTAFSTTKPLGSIRASESVVVSESDPGVAAWARAGAPEKQDRLPYPTNAIPASAISGASVVTAPMVTNVANDRIDAKVAPWAMAGQPQPTGSITDVMTNGASAVVGGVARIVVPSTNGLASAESVETAKAQAIVAATNIAEAVVREGVRTNWLCTVDAASAMTNSLPAWTKSADKPTYGYGEIANFGTGVIDTMSAQGISSYAINIGGTISGISVSDQYGNLRSAIDAKANVGDLPTPATPAFANAFASKATEASVATVSSRVDGLTDYISGVRVRLSVTNFYGNTSGEPPGFRVEEFDHSTTTVVAGVEYVTNYYRIVWDENTKFTNYTKRVDARIDAIRTNVLDLAWRQVSLQLAGKAPKAWQDVTSAGGDAPANTVWHTAPATVFAGGTEYAKVAVGDGTVCVLVDRGAPVYTEGAEGQFRFTDETRQNYFGFDVRSSYTIPCRTDGISVNDQLHMVSLTYDLTSETDPTVLHCTNLNQAVWVEQAVTWDDDPPAGTKVCYVDVTSQPGGFYKAEMSCAGGVKFVTNMQADLKGGIAATNETLNVTQSVEPYVVNGQVLWRVRQ